MWYVLWTDVGKEEKTKTHVKNHVDSSLYTHCKILYRRKRHFFQGESELVTLLLFPGYIFIETDNVKEFAEKVSQFPGRNIVLQTDNLFCPIRKEEEFLLTDFADKKGIIEMSSGYIDNNRVVVTDGPLKGYDKYIKKVIKRNSTAILEMTIFDKKVEYSLGLDIINR